MYIPEGLLADLIAALPMDDRIEIVDVGASNVSDKELPSYDALLTNNLARLTVQILRPSIGSELVTQSWLARMQRLDHIPISRTPSRV